MIKEARLPQEMINGGFVMRSIMEVNGEMHKLIVDKHTSIMSHKEEECWEVVIYLSKMTAWVCLKGEEHRVENMSDDVVVILTVKGKEDCSYNELAEFFGGLGFSVYHRSLIIKD